VKTETSSFRLDKEIFQDFKRHAKDQGLTTNSMINKIMKEYMQWNSKAPAIQVIPYPTKIIMALLKKRTEKEIREIASNHARESFSENMLLLKNEETIEAFLQFAKNWCDASGFPYSTKEKDGIINFTIRHNHGNTFSILLEEIIKTDIELLTKKRAETKQMTNSVSFWI
jgi:hypothetical protein